MSDAVHQSKIKNMKEEEPSTYLPIPQVMLGVQGKGDQIKVGTPAEPSCISDFALLWF